jgi:ferrochelatase
VRRFLAQFLSDQRVIDYPRWWWLPVLHGIILRTRPRRSARLYQRVWTEDGSPLLLTSISLAQKIEATLQRDLNVHVCVGMRYGNPSIPYALSQLRQHAVRRLLVLPLFPQYSNTTTGSTMDAIFDEARTWSWLPGLSIISDYHDHPAYIRAVADSIRQHHDPSSLLLFSFHGVPKSYLKSGDPYETQCQSTASLIANQLGLKPEEWSLAYQSRFGPAEWLKPYTDETLTEYGQKGMENINVVCPGFAIDCLETIDEIGVEGKNTFLNAGGRAFNYLPALNDTPDHVVALTEIIFPYLN